ncbi:MAG: metallophosphoesterase, partial [Bacteroidota bacterium]
MRNVKQHILFLLLTVFMSTVIWANEHLPAASAKYITDNQYIPIDGPYVFHESDKTVVRYVVLENNALVAKEEVFEAGTKIRPLSCSIDRSKMKGFTVTLRDKIASPPAIYEQPKKLFAISDIEGEFEIFAQTLQANKIIDKNYNWIYGRGHLVLNGDFFDRGINVTACLWLVYRLEQEAERAGGRVH